MTGHKHNKQKEGQVLLIAILLIATILTVVMATTFRSQTDTRTAKLEQDSQSALAAAQAAVEAALKNNGNVVIGQGDLASIGIGISGTATLSQVQDTEFVTPLLQQDQQYTFYFVDPSKVTAAVTNPWPGNISIFVDSEGNPTRPIVEISFYNSSGVRRLLVDASMSVPYATDGYYLNVQPSTEEIKGVQFHFTASGINPKGFPQDPTFTEPNPTTNDYIKYMVLRTLNYRTRIAIKGTVNLPVQGKTITSEAQTISGVRKKIQLFQSYPQLPAEFFVTSF